MVDESYLTESPEWQTCLPELRAAFRDVMKGYQYGYGPTLQAWHFFYCGWFKAGRETHGLTVTPP